MFFSPWENPFHTNGIKINVSVEPPPSVRADGEHGKNGLTVEVHIRDMRGVSDEAAISRWEGPLACTPTPSVNREKTEKAV